MLHTIINAVITGPHTVQVTYEDGKQVEVSVTALIDQGGVFAALQDQQYFRQVTIGTRGRFLSWPGELEICADAIRIGLPETVVS
jgi:hypothetical protein